VFCYSIDVNNFLLPDILHHILTFLDNIFELFILYIVEFLKKENFSIKKIVIYVHIYICVN